MPRRLLYALFGFGLLAALVLILRAGTDSASNRSPGLSTPWEVEETSPAELDAPTNSHTTAPPLRTEWEDPTPVAGEELDLGIPSFRGRVMLPNNTPATGATIHAWGLSGWAMYLDRAALEKPDTVQFQTTCGKDGRFALPESPRDGLRFIIRAQAKDFPPLDLQNLPATPGRTRELGDLTLAPGFQLSGIVTGQDGTAIAGARVVPVLEPDTAAFSRRRLLALPPLPGYESITDAQGSFSFEQLPPGRFHLRAQALLWADGYSAPVNGKSHDTVTDLSISLLPSLALTGWVYGPNGAGIPDARIRLDLSSEERLETKTDGDGEFQLDRPEESKNPRLRISAPGYRPTRVTVENPDYRQEIQLHPLPAIQGVVKDNLGRGVVGAVVRIVERSSSRRRNIHPSRLRFVGETKTDSEGGFHLSADIWRSWGEHFKIAAWSDTHTPAVSDDLDFRKEGEIPNFIELTLQEGLQISGVVLSPFASSLPKARVHLRKLYGQRPGNRTPIAPDTQRPGSILETTNADEEGQFSFSGLAVGAYRVEAHAPGFSPAESEELQLLHDSLEVALQVPAASALTGVVTGNRALFETLRVTASSPGRDPLDTTVDGEGEFEFPDIAPGDYDLVLREVDRVLSGSSFGLGTGDGLAEVHGISVAEGQTAIQNLHIDLEGRSILRGTVRVNGVAKAGMNLFLFPQDVGASGDPRLGWRQLSRHLRSAATDYRGEFLFAAVDPKDFWLVVDQGGRWPEGIFNFGGPDDLETGPTGLGRLEIELQENVELVRDFNLHLGTLIGRAMKNGKNGTLVPVRGGSGTLTPAPGSQSGVGPREIGLRRSGHFRLNQIPAGDWTLTLRGDGLRKNNFPVSVITGDQTVVEPVLEKKKR